ncbi:MAG: hypothetical protein AAF191_02345 [Verrucomicrobiota bacterium]
MPHTSAARSSAVHALGAPLQRRFIQVTDAHIEPMLDSLDSGMCDLETSNAVAIALRDHILGDAPWHIRLREGRWTASQQGRELRLPQKAGEWLTGCFQGAPPEPFRFSLVLPVTWIRPSEVQ